MLRQTVPMLAFLAQPAAQKLEHHVVAQQGQIAMQSFARIAKRHFYSV